MHDTECSRTRRVDGLLGGTAALILAALSADVVRNGPVSRAERDRVWKQTGPAAPWVIVTRLGDRPALATITAAACIAALARRGRALVPVVTVTAGCVARWVLMRVVGRDRPPRDRWRVAAEGASYPSRHATSAMLGALVLRQELPRSASLDATLGIGVFAVGLSRIRLGVHWPTDILAGWALATLVATVLNSALEAALCHGHADGPQSLPSCRRDGTPASAPSHAASDHRSRRHT